MRITVEVPFIVSVLYIRHCIECFVYIISFNLRISFTSTCCPHFTNEENEAQEVMAQVHVISKWQSQHLHLEYLHIWPGLS